MNLAPRDWKSHPAFVDAGYRSTGRRGPREALVPLPAGISELTGPVYGREHVGELDADLTRNGRRNGEPIGERMVVTGRLLDDDGHTLPDRIVEVWQANAAGRYVHDADRHDAPLDPNFLGAGRCVTDAHGRYRFYTVRPGAYPWGNHPNAWRPAHIHFSVLGPSLASRLVTQMYFPGDPLLALDPIFLAVPEHARDRLVADFSIDVTEPEFALGYVFDIVVRAPAQTPAQG